MTNRKVIFLAAAVMAAVGAMGQQVIRTSQYPNVSTLRTNDLLNVAQPDLGTNKNIRYDQLRNQLTTEVGGYIASTGTSASVSAGVTNWVNTNATALAAAASAGALPRAGGTMTGPLGLTNNGAGQWISIDPSIGIKASGNLGVQGVFNLVNSNAASSTMNFGGTSGGNPMQLTANASGLSIIQAGWPGAILLSNGASYFQGTVFAPAYSGSGAALTGLNGTNIQPGTIVGFIPVTIGGVGSNTVFADYRTFASGCIIVFTNSDLYGGGVAGGVDPVIALIARGTNCAPALVWQLTNNLGMRLSYSTAGSASPNFSEGALIADGKLSFCWNGDSRNPFYALQIGNAGDVRGSYIALSANGWDATHDGVPWCRSGSGGIGIQWRATYNHGAGTVPAIAGATPQTMGPFIWYACLNPSGDGVWQFYDYWDGQLITIPGVCTNQPNFANSSVGFERYSPTVAGGKGQISFRGSIITELSTSTPSSTNYAIDFRQGDTIQFTATGAAANFYTTNATGALTNSEERTVIVYAAGFAVNLTYPNWAFLATNGTPPAQISGSDMLELKLRSKGPGETNVICESAKVFKDPTFVYDGDALKHIATMSSVTSAQTNYLNSFFKSIKSDGTWTAMTNGSSVLSLFDGSNAASNGQNAITIYATNNMAWVGGFTTMDSTGVKSDGSGYGTNRFIPQRNSFTAFVFLKDDPATSGWLYGVSDGGVYVNEAGHNASANMFGAANSASAGIIGSALSTPTSFAITRSGASAWATYRGGVQDQTGTDASVAVENQSFLFLTRYNGGVDANKWQGKVQVLYLGPALSAGNLLTLHNACVALNAGFGR